MVNKEQTKKALEICQFALTDCITLRIDEVDFANQIMCQAIEELDGLKETIALYDEALTKMAKFIGDKLECCPENFFYKNFSGCKRSECDGNGDTCWKNWALYEKEELENGK